MHNFITCTCGSGRQRFAKYDGHGIFLTYVCDKCETEKMQQFRSDINEHYETDEPIDGDNEDYYDDGAVGRQYNREEY
jgi:hypothetical protein